jgi:hypothetical protein
LGELSVCFDGENTVDSSVGLLTEFDFLIAASDFLFGTLGANTVASSEVGEIGEVGKVGEVAVFFSAGGAIFVLSSFCINNSVLSWFLASFNNSPQQKETKYGFNWLE